MGGGSFAAGERADVVVFDPSSVWTVDASSLRTKSANTPLLGMQLQGRALMTLVGGEVRHDAR
jgi:dihydroorotase